MMEHGLDLTWFEDGPVEVVGGAQHTRVEVGDGCLGRHGVQQFKEAHTFAAELGLQLPTGDVDGVVHGSHAEESETFDQVGVEAQGFEQGDGRLAEERGDHVSGYGGFRAGFRICGGQQSPGPRRGDTNTGAQVGGSILQLTVIGTLEHGPGAIVPQAGCGRFVQTA